jgi:hypothetical protein
MTPDLFSAKNAPTPDWVTHPSRISNADQRFVYVPSAGGDYVQFVNENGELGQMTPTSVGFLQRSRRDEP